ncbi:hypothetical protein NEUTE2DRAFT_52534, partial [Neurospora tetrasperma FGSC 2509]
KFKYIAVVVNYFTKIQYYITTEIIKVEELADRFINRIYALYNLFNIIVSDYNS